VTVFVALPVMQPGIVNVQTDTVPAERPLRYREEWVTVQDAFGQEEEPMAVARFNLAFRFDHESNDAWQTCAVARLLRDGQGAWRQDPDFVPPMVMFSASNLLRERLVLLNRQLRSRRQRLMAMRRESNDRMADFAVADVSLFWLLNALNTHARVLTEFERFPARHPEQVWAELARLAGSMLTFSLDRDLDAIPGYDHQVPENTFPPLFELISELLEASLPSRVVAVNMTRQDEQTWKAVLHDIRLREEADFYLSVRSNLPAWQVAEKFAEMAMAVHRTMWGRFPVWRWKALSLSAACLRHCRCAWKISTSCWIWRVARRMTCWSRACACSTYRHCWVSLNLNYLRCCAHERISISTA
jgi:type VI secretion system protein ImpJ